MPMTRPIYTKRGDAGETSLADGTCVPKDSPRVAAMGAIDEASSHVGLARAAVTDQRLLSLLAFVQQRLFDCAGSLAAPPDAASETSSRVDAEDVAALERAIDTLTEPIGELSHFVVPSGSEAAARLHVARTVVRRAERELAALAREEPIDADVRAFVNRLSDLLFTAARYANHVDGFDEVAWDPDAPRPDIDTEG
jgi:cob(I)alamin adenosyltransferase